MDKLKISYLDLDEAATLALLKSHRTAMTGNVLYPVPLPDDAAIGDLITALTKKIGELAIAKGALTSATIALAKAVADGRGALAQRATHCNSVTPRNPAKLITSGLPLVGGRTPAGPTPRVEELRLAEGAFGGTVAAKWKSMRRKAVSYQIQSTLTVGADPNTATWATHDPVTKATAQLGPFPPGTRIWVRVRAIGTKGPGPWSDPATIIVP